jgi:sRNA-binding protein
MSETPTPAAHPEVIAPPTEPDTGPEAAEAAAVEAGATESAVGSQDADEVAPAADALPAPATLSPAAVAALLAQHFPALFGAGRALPIKLRIQADIQTRAPGLVNKKSLSVFLHRYTTSTAYLKALATQPQRLDLDGAAAGDIDVLHRDAAAAEVERRKQMFEDRRALEREKQRAAAQEARRAQNAQNAARTAARDNAEGEARRNRAVLLRAFETATLTKANFCALKGISESELDAQVVLARQEREQRALEPRPEPRPDHRNDQRRSGGGGGGGGRGGGARPR